VLVKDIRKAYLPRREGRKKWKDKLSKDSERIRKDSFYRR
jgi:hypothetical protein